MNKYSTAWLLMFLFAYIGNRSHASTNDDWDPSRTWSRMPWQARYLLFVDSAANRIKSIEIARRGNTDDRKKIKQHVYLDSDELLTKISIFATPAAPSIGVTLLAFDRNGTVVTNDRALRGFTGKLSAMGNLVLMRNDAPDAKPYDMLDWSQGIPGNSSFGPSPCTFWDAQRYKDDWESGKYPGDFGCREWTAQLFDDERPYIDVTTYTRRGNFIGQFVGWSRFKDAPKPVIGMNGKTWLCLHECPAGEMAGVIGDILIWTRKHHYPMPVPPAYQPEYPNKNYYDDLHEMDED